jgi:hypothetical protein
VTQRVFLCAKQYLVLDPDSNDVEGLNTNPAEMK